MIELLNKIRSINNQLIILSYLLGLFTGLLFLLIALLFLT